MGQRGGVDDHAQRAWRVLLQEIDELAFGVALKEAHLDLQRLRLRAHELLQVGERPRAVDLRLPLPEQVEIRPVDDDHTSAHASALVTTRRTRAPGTTWPISAWPSRRGRTHATLPRRAFLSSAIAASTRFGSALGVRSGRPNVSSSAFWESARRGLHSSIDTAMFADTRIPNATARPWETRKPVAASSAWPAVWP